MSNKPEASKATSTKDTEADIFDVPAENLVGGGESGEGYKATDGPHFATIVAIVDVGDVHSEKFNKTQRKGYVVWALADQNVTYKKEGSDTPEDSGEPVIVTSAPITIGQGCFSDKAAVTKLFKSLNLPVDPKTTKLGDLVGVSGMIFTKLDDEGRYVQINSVNFCPPAMKQNAIPKNPVYLPKFLLEKDGVPTGYRIKAHPTLVIPGVRPKHEQA
jgi:hypothetical protein